MVKRLLLLLAALLCPAILYGQATNYCNDQFYQTFEGGTTGQPPTPALLAASSKGRSMIGSTGNLWTVNQSANVLTYSGGNGTTAPGDMPALVAPGRLCGDLGTYTNSAGTNGLVLTGDGLADSNFVSVRIDLSPVYPNNMTDVYASVEYNEDFGASGDKIDCFVIHGTSDFSSVNCYGDTSPRRFFDLECTNTPTSHGGDCGTGGGVVWTPATQCPCKLVLHYGTGNGTTLGHHDLWAYDKNGALIGHIQHTSQLAADNPVYIKLGNQIGQGSVTAGKHAWWDNFQFSPSLPIPGQFCAGASPTWTTSPDNVSMQTCLNNASSTDTVNVLSGTATWNTVTVNNNNGASIAGATTVSNAGLINASAVDGTIINFTGGTNIFLGNLTQTSTVTTVSGITWKWASGGSGNSGVVSFVGPNSGTSTACTPTGPTWRFTSNHIVVNTTTAGTVFSDSSCNWGVIDHNFYERQAGNAGMFSSHGDAPYRGYHAWTSPLNLGSQQATYIETNTFNDAGGNNTEGPFDCYDGARFVMRFNYVQGHDGGCHGTDSDPSRSVISQEDFGNTFLNNTGVNYVTSRVRGGTALIFENVYNSAAGNVNNTFNGISLTEYRDSGPPCTNCANFGNPALNLYVESTDPTNVLSVTTSTTVKTGQFCGPKGRDNLVATGDNVTCNSLHAGDTASTFFDGPGPYPARDQVGRVPTAAQGQALEPAYQWLNIVNGNSGNSALMVPGPPTTFIQECRDFYNYSPTFAGGSCATCSGSSCTTTGGGGAGTTLPATCALNEFFWKTNEGTWNSSTLTFPDGTSQGKLYQCGPTVNTWTLYYTPLAYPHPLVAGASATPILSPNNSQTGNSANSVQPPVLAFGQQGTNTPSMAIPISINNCSTPNIAACTGAGNLTLAATPLAITGTNASDFTFALGTCSANLVIAHGASCSPTITFTPTAANGTNETATLTVSYQNGTPSSTMSLTGTSSTIGTTLSTSACPTALTTQFYQVSADITCGGTAFTFTGAPVVNLNGHTITWNNTAQTTATGAFTTGGFNESITVYNGTISQGAGTNSQSTTYTNSFLAAIGPGAGNLNFADNNSFFNLTFNQSFQYWSAIDTLGPGSTGGNLVVHDVTINDSAVGNCGAPNCRSQLQSTAIRQPGTVNQPATATHYYNVTVNGSAQGGLMAQAPGAVIEHNLVNIGNITGTNSNNFGIYAWGPVSAHDNIINIPLGSNTNGRGLAMQGDGPSGTKSGSNNVIQAFELPNSTEYASNANCEIGGAYGIQFDDNPQGPSVNSNGNKVTVQVNKCGGTGLRLTDTELATNTSTNNTYTVSRQTGALDCTIQTEADPNFGCAFGASIDGNNSPTTTAFTSTGDTFFADSGMILIGEAGIPVSNVVFQSPVFNKGSNPSATFHTFWASNGVAGSLKVIDATFGTGVSPTDTRFLAQSSVQAPISLYVQWTQNITVQHPAGVGVSGATVTYTGPFETDSCTTNSSGQCSLVITQYRLHNDTAANQIENRNPYTRSIASGICTTNTTNNITVSSTNTLTIVLVCNAIWDAAANGRDYVNGSLQTGKGYSNTVTGANGRKYP